MKKNINKKEKKSSVKTKSSAKKEKKIERGTMLECMECGMVVVVDDICGCEEYHPIVCCDEPMSVK